MAAKLAAKLAATLDYIAKWADTWEGVRRHEAERSGGVFPTLAAGPLQEIHANLEADRAFARAATGAPPIMTEPDIRPLAGAVDDSIGGGRWGAFAHGASSRPPPTTRNKDGGSGLAAVIRASVRRLVRSMYGMRCGSCLISEADVGADLTFDRFQRRSQGGSDDAANLVSACHACNEFKGEYYGVTEETRLLHPLRDDLTLNLRQEADGTRHGITPAGERYSETLPLNRPPLMSHRRADRRAELVVERDRSLNERLDQIMIRIERMESQTRARRGR